MRIIAITQPNTGVGYHRILMPIQFMEKTYALFTDQLSDELLEQGFDVMVINRYVYNTDLEAILKARDKYGFKLIVDIDDYWHLDPWHVIYSTYPTLKIIEHIKAADMVTCTNELLRAEIFPLNKNVHILPNALPYGRDQFTEERTESDKVRFVWAGGITHEKDLEIIRGPFKRLSTDHEIQSNAKFIIAGYRKSEIWDRMVSFYTAGLKLPCGIKTSLDVNEYMNLYNESDCLIVPLVGSKFNGMKSNLKVLEAGAKKIPVIASGVSPYKECPFVIQINKQSEWYPAVKKVLKDAIYRRELGQANHSWCVENHHLDKVNQVRAQLYSNV